MGFYEHKERGGTPYRATVKWKRGGATFTDQRYSRGHTWSFDGGITVPASSSPLSVRLPYSVAEAVDPEEAFVAALVELPHADVSLRRGEAGLVVDAYADEAVGEMTKNERGKMWVSKVTLRPRSRSRARSARRPQQFDELHHLAHEECFIANSVKSEVVVRARCRCVRPENANALSAAHTRRPPEMLARIGVADIDALFADIPAAKRLQGAARPAADQERDRGRAHARPHGGKNVAAGSVPFFVGCGAYKHHIPASVDHLIQRSEFLTSYTPYQPEIAQGTLQYLFEFQTQVAMLTGMEVANASMYDGSTAAAEAVLMAHRVTKRQKAVLSRQPASALPRDGRDGVAHGASDEVVALPRAARRAEDILAAIDNETSCVVVQTPDVYGQLHDLQPIAEKAHAAGALLVAVFTEVVSLGLVHAAGRDGRRHRGRRGAVDRQRAELRRALCRPVRDAAEISCGRCRAGSPARRSMPKASAASC